MATGEKMTTIRVDNRTLKRVDGFARANNRSRNWVINQAVEHFIDYDKWFAREVKAGLRDVELGRVVDHEEIVKKLEREREDYLDARRRTRS